MVDTREEAHAVLEDLGEADASAAEIFNREWLESQPTLLIPSISIDQLPTMQMPALPLARRSMPPRSARREATPAGPFSLADSEFFANEPIDQAATWLLPAVGPRAMRRAATRAQQASVGHAGGYVHLLRNLVKSSGIYAVASLIAPLVSLILSPFLTRQLSVTDYGILAILTTLITLGAGVTQLGLSSAFFRAYSYDYTDPRDRRGVVATTTLLLSLVSIVTLAVAVVGAAPLAGLLIGSRTLGGLIVLAALVILLQNLSVPGFAWLRAEDRPFFFSLLSLTNVFVNLAATFLLVGALRAGLAGALIATGSGYAFVIVCTLPVLLGRFGLRLRLDIARGMLAFGTPMILNFVAYWVLQLSDRYLLSILGALAQTASYSVAYSLGTVLSTVIISPFTLAWPTAMYAIAKRKDAPQVFRLVFRWFGALLLFAAFGFSLAGRQVLIWFFPPSYASAAPVIPLVAQSIALYGVYQVFMVGANMRRKTWLAAVFMGAAALVNLLLNLVLIPADGALGAAISTLVAFAALTLLAYIVNQVIYPIPFEMGRFVLAALAGVACYLGSASLSQSLGTFWTWPLDAAGLLVYSICLLLLTEGFRFLRHPRRFKGGNLAL